MRIIALTGSQASATAYAAMLNDLGYQAWATIGADEVMALTEEAAPVALLLALDADSVQLREILRRTRAVSPGLPVVLALTDSSSWLRVPLPAAVAPATVVRRSGLTADTLARALASLGVNSRTTIEEAPLQLDATGRRLEGPRGSAVLTASEGRLMAAFLEGSGESRSFEELARAVWGDDTWDRARMVALRTHVYGLRRKLQAVGAAGSLLSEPGRGYRLLQ